MSIYLGRILMAMIEQPTTAKPADAPLEPIRAGAWAAWAKAERAGTKPAPEAPTVASGSLALGARHG